MDLISLLVLAGFASIVVAMLVVPAIYYSGARRFPRAHQAVHWYWINWHEVTIYMSLIILVLALGLGLLFLSPPEWWEKYDQPGVGTAEVLCMLMAVIMGLIVMPAVFLPHSDDSRMVVN